MYNTDDLEKQSLEAIRKHKLMFIEHLVAYLPCDKTTFYAHKLNESNAIAQALLKNKITNNGIDLKDRVTLKGRKGRKKGSGYVYLVHCDGSDFYKIGRSKNEYEARLSSLQTGCPYDLFMIKVWDAVDFISLEKLIHEELEPHHHRGEWFVFNERELLSVKNKIDELCTTQIA